MECVYTYFSLLSFMVITRLCSCFNRIFWELFFLKLVGWERYGYLTWSVLYCLFITVGSVMAQLVLCCQCVEKWIPTRLFEF